MEVDLAKEEYIREAVERIDDVSSNAHLYCFFLLKQSVYWFQSGRSLWVSTPKFAEHMDFGAYGYQLKMGANIFLVEKFLLGSLNEIQEIVEATKSGVEYEFNTVKYLIEKELKKCVMHEDGMTYLDYPVKSGHLMFGVHGISVDKSFTSMCGITGLYKLLI